MLSSLRCFFGLPQGNTSITPRNAIVGPSRGGGEEGEGKGIITKAHILDKNRGVYKPLEMNKGESPKGGGGCSSEMFVFTPKRYKIGVTRAHVIL